MSMQKTIGYRCRFLTGLVAAGFCLALAPRASAQDVTIGQGIACDTPAEVQRFFAILEDDAEVAIEQVNAEVGKKSACGMLYFAFRKGDEVAKGWHAKGSYKVVEATILAVFDGQKWRPVPGMKQYTAVDGPQEWEA